jgi:tRNA uridine 5-carboxymethylaminomethyl modification enzyme
VDLVERSGVQVIEGEVSGLAVEGSSIAGIHLAGLPALTCRSVVLATGTFLGATMFCGEERWQGGRPGARPAPDLGRQIRELGLAEGRLKTGTPPRIDGRTIDWSRLTPQPSDPAPWTMSLLPQAGSLPQLSCAITRTNERSHDVIRRSLSRSPLFSGSIEGRGPRYCPSIEDKIHRFGDRDGHQIFLEPEGLNTPLVYPNGISTSLPADVQQDFIATVVGLERARIVRPGYAVEYEFADPRRLGPTLEHSEIAGLFFAGQLNGTTGYEEAAAQGLVAGFNAAARAKDLPEVTFQRESSYIGVMVDDLTLQGVSEPYRMLTARSEYRLHLRVDNAVSRLGPQAIAMTLLGDEHKLAVEKHMLEKKCAEERLRDSACGVELGIPDDVARSKLSDCARRGEAIGAVREMLPKVPAASEAIDDAFYAPYLERQRNELSARQRDRETAIPYQFNFAEVPGLSNEMRERLERSRPANLDQASRVAGITPAAISALHFALIRRAA